MVKKCNSSQIRRKRDGKCLKRSSPAGKRVISARRASRSRSPRRSRTYSIPSDELRCMQIKQDGMRCKLPKGIGCRMFCTRHAQEYDAITGCVDGNGFTYKSPMRPKRSADCKFGALTKGKKVKTGPRKGQFYCRGSPLREKSPTLARPDKADWDTEASWGVEPKSRYVGPKLKIN